MFTKLAPTCRQTRFSTHRVFPMSNAWVCPPLISRYFTGDGVPLVGGLLYSYQAGTDTPFATFTDSTEETPNPNPVVLDGNGAAEIWIGTGSYKFVLTDSSGNPQWTIDNVTQPGTGPAGQSFFTGAGAPSNTLGQSGDSYLDINTGDIWLNTAGTWAQTLIIWTKYNVTDGQSAANLAGQTVDGTIYTSAKYDYEIIRGTTVIDNGIFYLQYANDTWRVSNGGDFGDLSGVTFSVTQTTTVGQLQAALNSGAGNGTIKVSRVLVPV